MLTVEAYVARRAESVAVDSAAGYFRAAGALAAGPEVTARGREAGDALGTDPAAAVAEVAARVVPLVEACDGTEVVTTIVGGMRLADYLPTRTFELVVHTADLSAALGVPADIPATAAAQALRLVGELAVDRHVAAPLLLAVTGRQGLPPGFTIL